MIEYVQKLWREPSKENLDRVNHELWRSSEIVINYHFLLTELLKNSWEIETPEIIKIKKQIELEEQLISECREIVNKIEEALKAKK